MSREADAVVCLTAPAEFFAVGQFFEDFAQVTDEAVGEGLEPLVVGGSQGARAVNEIVAAWVRGGVPAGWQVIWATGRGSFDTYAALESERVRVRPYLAPIAHAYAAADLALCRAGAMTTAELCAWGIPMVLVPLPTAAAGLTTRTR